QMSGKGTASGCCSFASHRREAYTTTMESEMHQSVLSAWRCSNWLLLAALFIVPASQARSPDDPAAAPQATRAIYTVGEQADCDFSNLQDAIHAATPGDTIRIARSTGHLGNTYTLYGKSLTLRGGFDSCNAG